MLCMHSILGSGFMIRNMPAVSFSFFKWYGLKSWFNINSTISRSKIHTKSIFFILLHGCGSFLSQNNWSYWLPSWLFHLCSYSYNFKCPLILHFGLYCGLKVLKKWSQSVALKPVFRQVILIGIKGSINFFFLFPTIFWKLQQTEGSFENLWKTVLLPMLNILLGLSKMNSPNKTKCKLFA